MNTYVSSGIIGVVLLLATPAGADDSRRATVQAMAQKGIALLEAERWQEAYDQLRQADELYHAPTLTLRMAQALSKLGKLLEARELYRRILEESLPEGAPAGFIKAKENARTELDALNARIPVIAVTVTGTSYEAAGVRLDGVALSEGRHEVNPGSHTIEACPATGYSVVKTVTLADGDFVKVDFTPPKHESVMMTAPKTFSPAPTGASVNKGVVIGGAALSAVALGVGLGLTGWWAHLENDQFCIKQAPNPSQCKQTWASVKTASTWTLVGAGVVAAGTLTYGLLVPRIQRSVRASASIGPAGASAAFSLEW